MAPTLFATAGNTCGGGLPVAGEILKESFAGALLATGVAPWLSGCSSNSHATCSAAQEMATATDTGKIAQESTTAVTRREPDSERGENRQNKSPEQRVNLQRRQRCPALDPPV